MFSFLQEKAVRNKNHAKKRNHPSRKEFAELKNQKPNSAYLASCGPVEQCPDIVRGEV